MEHQGRRLAAVGLLIASCATSARAQTTLNGNVLALRSSGAASGTDWTLSENGYVGSYITLAAPADVTINVNASGVAGGGASPHMNIVIGDQKAPFDVTAGFNAYQHTFSLPAGTHFVRTEFNNDAPTASRSLTVRSLGVAGAALENVNDDAHALAAADTYIQNGRRGAGHLSLVGGAPGASVALQLKQHAFNWGANMHGTSSSLLSNTQYTNFFKSHFNMVVPSRAGKWNNNESTRDVVTSIPNGGYVDGILDFAEANGLRARMHNVIWGTDSGAEQPAWALNMLNNPTAIDPVSGKMNIDALRDEISERLDYYVGDGAGGYPELSKRYKEVDIYNESWHTGVNTPTSDANYWDRYGAAGISGIYKEAADAAAAAGSDARMYTNEYNVFNWGDSYANWYRQHIEDIQNADSNPANGPVSGVGIQLYLGTGGGALSPVRAAQSMNTLSALGLPQSITEFGVSSDVTDPAVAKDMVNKSLRLAFGYPDMNTFMYWGFWGGGTGSAQSASILANTDFSLTDIGKMYEDLLGIHDWDGNPSNGWTTNLSLSADADGSVDFTGFYGDYIITTAGHTYSLNLQKGTTDYQLVINLSADFDNNGRVDSNDLTVWKQQFDMGGTGGDADGDGDTDGDDLLVWQQQLGMVEATPTASAPSGAIVPEPASLWLMAAAAIGFCRLEICRRKRFFAT